MDKIDELIRNLRHSKFSGGSIQGMDDVTGTTFYKAGDVNAELEELRPYLITELDRLKIELADLIKSEIMFYEISNSRHVRLRRENNYEKLLNLITQIKEAEAIDDK